MPWFQVDDDFPTHPGVLATSLAARGLWVTAGAWSSKRPDDVLPDHVLASLGGTPELAAELCTARVWRRVRGGYKFVQEGTCKIPTKEAVENERKAAAERQRRSREARQSRRDSGVTHGGVTVPNTNTNTNTNTSTANAVEDHVRDDIEHVCQHLADRIAANGSKRPSVTKRWRDAARLMLDSDGRTEQQVITAIDWCQDHEFWRSVILSMPKLRQKYDQLRLQASRHEILNGHQAKTDAQFDRAMARAEARENHDPQGNSAAHPLRQGLLPAAGDG